MEKQLRDKTSPKACSKQKNTHLSVTHYNNILFGDGVGFCGICEPDLRELVSEGEFEEYTLE